MRIGLVVTGGFDRGGRERVVPTLLWLVERLARRHQVHVFVVDYYREPCDYPLLGATVHDLGRVPGPSGSAPRPTCAGASRPPSARTVRSTCCTPISACRPRS